MGNQTAMKSKIRFWRIEAILFCVFFLLCCTDKDESLIIINPWVNYGSLTDVEGNTYKTILIGTQTWMVNNLTTTRLNDGTSIPIVTDAATWSNITTPACCWQNNDPARKITYGVLYNWYTVNSGKLCPSQWHVPGDADWTLLTDYLGGENVAGGKLKSKGFRHWNSPNTEASDEANFRGLPGGNRQNGPESLFENLGKMGCWWTTDQGSQQAMTRLMYFNSITVQKSFYPKQWGLSVRCVRDY